MEYPRFLPVNFENMFSKYARTVPDKFTLKELWNMTEANRVPLDFLGWYTYSVHWIFTWFFFFLITCSKIVSGKLQGCSKGGMGTSVCHRQGPARFFVQGSCPKSLRWKFVRVFSKEQAFELDGIKAMLIFLLCWRRLLAMPLKCQQNQEERKRSRYFTNEGQIIVN